MILQKIRRHLGKMIFAALLVVGAIGYFSTAGETFDTGAPLTADANQTRIDLIGADFSMENLPQGWVHRSFWNTTPTEYALKSIDGREALFCATDNSGSILARDADIDLAEFPILKWEWLIAQPLVSDVDEGLAAGDDHPARIFLIFEDAEAQKFATEIIWSNQRFLPGDFKIIGAFQHLVVNGLPENAGIWQQQEVDLQELYRTVSGQTGPARLSVIGFFCDSDNTGGTTSAYFSDVRLEARGG